MNAWSFSALKIATFGQACLEVKVGLSLDTDLKAKILPAGTRTTEYKCLSGEIATFRKLPKSLYLDHSESSAQKMIVIRLSNFLTTLAWLLPMARIVVREAQVQRMADSRFSGQA
jgi:hypothetical protein